MMNGRRSHTLILLATTAIALSLCILCIAVFGSSAATDSAAVVGRSPRIHPDFTDTVIPPNIAPVNFQVRESGTRYRVRIRPEQGSDIEIESRTAKIEIPERKWRRVLSGNRGKQVAFDVLVQSEAGADGTRAWRRFDTFRITIANEEIDNYIAYRRIHPAHSAWRRMGLYERDLRSFDESTIITNDYFKGGCVNCHTFCNNRPETMLVSTRSGDYGSAAVLIDGDTAEKVGTKFGYSTWHPSGKIVAYAGMKVVLFLHSAGEEVRDVIDLDSLLSYYDVPSKTVKTTPDLARKDRLETYPTWSPDGKYLYFCSAPLTWSTRNSIPEEYKEVRYDLVRVAYDVDQDAWGPMETVLSASDTGRSILLPRISPDGRWLLFSMCEYGCFPVYQKSSDLYRIDLDAAKQTGTYAFRRLEINSDESESWHSWSSNSRWIAFSSKRGNGTFTRTYISYVDPNGTAHKPFVLPQKDPTHYDSCLWTYSVPELIAAPVQVRKESLARVIRSPRQISVEMPVTMATPKAPEGTPAAQPYMSTRE